MPRPDIEYNIVVSTETEGTIINWGNEPNWADKYRELLDSAVIISLVPKKVPSHLRPVAIKLGDDRRWIIFSRVYGQVTGGKEIRLYAIGWQKSIGDKTEKSITWVYPDGGIENTGLDGPSFWKEFL